MRHNILVTGGSGFLGKHLILKLINMKHNVFLLERKNKKRIKILSKKPKKIIVGNFTNKKLMAEIIKENNIDAVFHLGAITQVLDSLTKPYNTYINNIMGTINLLENIRAINKKIIFIYSSSDKAYGEVRNRKEYKEDHALDPTYPYDVSKSSSDLICQSYSKTYSMKVGIIRSANIYGPGDFNSKRLIPEIILSMMENKNFKFRSNGKSKRDYVFVEDVVDAYLRLFKYLKKSKDKLKIYNVSSKPSYTALDIYKIIIKIMGKAKLKPIILNNSKQELNFQRLNCSKIQRELNWKPKMKFETGLKKTIDWYVKVYNILKR